MLSVVNNHIMLSVVNKPIMLSVLMPNAVMLSVVAPYNGLNLGQP